MFHSTSRTTAPNQNTVEAIPTNSDLVQIGDTLSTVIDKSKESDRRQDSPKFENSKQVNFDLKS